ncbi:MAG: ATP-binding protein [Proteobacteria bacterium]|nr:ATP-binding protein [Pseudomonadota bacterium]
MAKQSVNEMLIEGENAFTYLRKSRLFSVLTDAELNTLMPIVKLKSYENGTKLLVEGEACNAFHLLLGGRLGIYLENEPILELKRKGDIVGEMSVVSKKHCTATVKAIGEVKVFSIDTNEIGSYAQKHSRQLEAVLYRLFAMIMTDKLTMTTEKAKRFEQERRQIRNARADLKQARAQLDEHAHQLADAKEKAEAANQAKTDFLANVSHELRNPMHQVLSYSSSGIRKIERPKEKLLYYFSQIRKSADRLMIFLNDLLDLSKMESGKMVYSMENHDLWEILQSVTEEFGTFLIEKKIDLTLIEPKTPTRITCDDFRVGQVIRNLLSNALKYTPKHKRIELSISESSLPKGRRSSDKDTIPALVLSVKDEGVGIPEAELISVFDKFVQSSTTSSGAGGTGLGLAICKEIMDAHNGRIWAESNLGGGVTFHMLLPLRPAGIVYP